MSVIITVSNQKGGVGKTTTSAALASGLSMYGKKVLGIDLDPQGNLSFSLSSDPAIKEAPTVLDVLSKQVSIWQAIQRTPSCDLLTSDITLSSNGLEQISENREFALRDLLEPVSAFYDYIVIDTPPALNLLTVNAYAASRYLIIPMSPDILGLVGLSQLTETVESVRSSFNRELQVLGILLTKYTKHTRLSQDVFEMASSLAGRLHTHVFDAKIRNCIAIAEAPAHGENIFSYASSSNGSADYQAFLKEIAPHIGLKGEFHAKKN